MESGLLPAPWNKHNIPKYGYYLVFTDNPGKDPWIHCNNETSKGVWVYKTKSRVSLWLYGVTR